jgi:peptidoglycan/LPS O-acetylase OafA/YrhL
LELTLMVFRPFIAPRFDLAAKPRSETVELPRGHVPALDAVRGLAILVVTLYRFGGGAGGAASAVEHWWLVELGSRGVDLFFVLSGFLITGILFDAKGKEHYFRDFYARRALRIFPLYYAALFVTLVVLPVIGGSVGAEFRLAAEQQGWLWLYGTNVLQALRGEWCLGPLNHFWSLAIEEHFYLVWPLVIYFSSRRTAMWICGGVFGFSIVARAGWLACGGNDVAAEVLTPLRMDGLALGSWLALVSRAPRGLGWLNRYAMAVFALFAAGALVAAVLERRFYGLPYLCWAGASGALLVVVVAARREGVLGRLGQSGVLQFFGKFSYGLYVFQLPLIATAAGVITAPGLASEFGNAAVGQVIYCAVMFTATTLMAVASWHLFEKRWLTLKQYFV